MFGHKAYAMGNHRSQVGRLGYYYIYSGFPLGLLVLGIATHMPKLAGQPGGTVSATQFLEAVRYLGCCRMMQLADVQLPRY